MVRHSWIGLIVGITALAYGTTLAPGISWANHGEDGSELIAAVLVGGVPHPSGYPTYLLLARAITLLPFDPAHAGTWLSALAAIVAALALADLVRRRADVPEPWASGAAVMAGLSLALAPLVWSQAVIIEVYTLSMAFAALLLRAACTQNQDQAAGSPDYIGVVGGLALGTHLLVAPFVLFWWFNLRSSSLRRFLLRGAWLGLGLLVYLYIPLLAAGDPPINWGNPTDWRSFWWLVSGRLYSGMLFDAPLAQQWARLTEFLHYLLLPAGLVSAGLAGWGLIKGPLTLRERLATWLIAGAILLFSLGYNSRDAQMYLIPALLPATLWLGLGIAQLAHSPLERYPLPTLGVVALILFANTPAVGRTVDAGNDLRAQQYVEDVLAAAPVNALIFSSDDRSTFPLWYAHFGLGLRPDLRLTTTPLLGFAWYRDQLSRSYNLPLPQAEPPEGWEATVEALYRPYGPVCRSSAGPPTQLVCTAADDA